MKQLLFLICCFFATASFANSFTSCPPATATTDPSFCTSFETAAICRCKEKTRPAFCQTVQTIYNAMIARYHSIDEACRRGQTDTDPQTCIDDWNCYLYGGRDSKGGLCSSTGASCPG